VKPKSGGKKKVAELSQKQPMVGIGRKRRGGSKRNRLWGRMRGLLYKEGGKNKLGGGPKRKTQRMLQLPSKRIKRSKEKKMFTSRGERWKMGGSQKRIKEHTLAKKGSENRDRGQELGERGCKKKLSKNQCTTNVKRK